MTQSTFSSFNKDIILSLLPSPKLTTATRVGVHNWYYDYAAFSEDFALSALKALIKSKDDVVLDPFLGSGTSLVAARLMGQPFIGVELSPFSALLSRAKGSCNISKNKISRILLSPPPYKTELDREFYDWFSPIDLDYTTAVINNIFIGLKTKNIINALLTDYDGKYDDYCVALVGLLISAKKVAKLSSGSNPVWNRVAQKGERYRRPSLAKLTVGMCNVMMQDLKHIRQDDSMRTISKVILGDSRNIILPSQSVDVILTSPPYLNRLDYVVNQLPNLLLLSLFHSVDIESLRKEMIGTTKIVEKGSPDPKWGLTCLDILTRINNHHSKASSTYYIWNYYKYFKDIYNCFKELKRLSQINAEGILVVQNSHYKDISIPVTAIFMEMGQNLGITINEIKYKTVKSHMGLLSPQQRSYAPGKTLREAILHLKF